MRNASSAFQRALADGRRDYIYKVIITLDDGYDTPIPGRAGENYLDNEDIWEGGLTIDDAVSEDNVFQVGAAIINQCMVVLNNIDGYFDDYDFDNAKVIPYVGFADLDDSTTEYLRMGTYSVDEAGYNGTTITLTCLDGMSVFDQPYNNHNMYPATLHDIVSTACTDCGVILATPLFHRYGFTVSTPPSDESTTYRQVISWCAQIAGSFARFNDIGQLEIKFYNTASLDDIGRGYDGGIFDDSMGYYTTGDDVRGGTFNPWSGADNADGGTFNDGSRDDLVFITSDYSATVAVDNVVITGVKVTTKNTDDDAASSYVDYLFGDEGYVIAIEGNELIAPTDVEDVARDLGGVLNGLTFRKANITHPSDPTIEAGDVGVFADRKGNQYPIIISSTTFTSGSSQNTNSSAASVKKNSSQRFTEATKNYVELRKQIQTQKTQWETVTDDLADRIEAAGGLYCTEVTDTSGTKTYYHDKPLLSESDIVMLFSDVGFTMTANYQDQSPTWYGMTVDGQMIASQLHTLAASFVWAVGGQMTLGGANNGNGILRIVNASGTEIGRWDKDGITASGSLSLKNVVNSGVTTTAEITSYLEPIEQYVQLQTMYGLDIRNEGTNTNHFRISTYEDTPYSYNNLVRIHSNAGIEMTAQMLAYDNFGPKLRLYNNNASLSNGYNGHSVGVGPTMAWIGAYEYTRTTDTSVFASPVNVRGEISGTSLAISGTKQRVVDTDDYSERGLYCYEMASPMFGDIGEGTIAEDGQCYVSLDPIFIETISTSQYQVFLQKYGNGDCWVKERHGSYFVVAGTPGMAFGWEIKAKQLGYEANRMDVRPLPQGESKPADDYADEAQNMLLALRQSRVK